MDMAIVPINSLEGTPTRTTILGPSCKNLSQFLATWTAAHTAKEKY